jgi:peptidyl-tRNA hydrolase
MRLFPSQRLIRFRVRLNVSCFFHFATSRGNDTFRAVTRWYNMGQRRVIRRNGAAAVLLAFALCAASVSPVSAQDEVRPARSGPP